MYHLILAAAVAVSSTAAPATDVPAAATSTTSSTQAAAPARAQRYCVVQEITGSLTPARTCQTREQWLADGFDPLAPRR